MRRLFPVLALVLGALRVPAHAAAPAPDGLIERVCTAPGQAVDEEGFGPRFDLPVYLAQGAQDLLTMPQMTKPWFDSLQATRKSYVLVQRAGHDPNPPLLAAQYKVLKDDVGACR